jgi:hypothetical protein
MNSQHTIIFNSTINAETVQDVINEANMYPYVNFYFSTDGGNLNEMNILIDFLNYRYREDSLKLILYDFVASAGTLLLINYQGDIYLQQYFRGFMFHAPDITVNTIRPGIFGKKAKELLNVMNEDLYVEYMRLGLTKADIAKIRNGEDIYVWFNELNKIKRKFIESEETHVQIIQKTVN